MNRRLASLPKSPNNILRFLRRAQALLLPVAVSAAAFGFASMASAQTYTFDADTTTAGAQDGSGVWDTTTPNFYNSTTATDVVWPSDFATKAIFGAGAGAGAAGTVTVSAVNANGITFNAPGSGNYTLTGGTITLGGTTPTITNAVASTIGSVIAGNTGVTQINLTNTVGTNNTANALTLTGANTFNGLWVLANSGGTATNYGNVSLILNNTSSTLAAPTILGNLQIGNSALVTGALAAAPNQFSANSVVSFGGNKFANFILHANQTIAGLSAVAANGADVEIVSNTDLASAYGNVTLTLGGTASYSYLGGIRNTDGTATGGPSILSIVKNGSGTQTFGGADTYTGSTTINAGSLKFNTTAAAIPTGTTFYLGATSGTASATLEYGTGSTTTVPGAINVVAGSSGTLQISNTSGAPTFSGPINLANNLTLFNNNTSPNATTVSNAATGINGTGNLTVDETAAGGVTLSGLVNHAGTISYIDDSSGRANTVGLTISGTIGANVTGIIANHNSTQAVIANQAPLIISGTNNAAFIGDTTLTRGVLDIQSSTGLQNSVIVTNSGAGLLEFGAGTATTITAVTLGGLQGNGNINLNNIATTPVAVALTLGNSNASNGSATNPNTLNPTYSGILSNTVGVASVTKVGSNTQTFSGANTYSGGTMVSAGLLATATTGSFGTGNVTITSTGSLTLGNTASIASTGSLLFAATTTINLNFTGTDTVAGITNTTSGISEGPGMYSATDLNGFFGGSNFTGTGMLQVVPEPSTWMILIGGLGALVAARQVRHRRA